jgi:hypothetical protein
MGPCMCGAPDCWSCGVGPVQFAKDEYMRQLEKDRQHKIEELKEKHGEYWEDYFDENDFQVEEEH